MQIESSNNSKEKNYSQSLKNKIENISCKDGFCSLKNQHETSSIQKNKLDLFDPI